MIWFSINISLQLSVYIVVTVVVGRFSKGQMELQRNKIFSIKKPCKIIYKLMNIIGNDSVYVFFYIFTDGDTL